MSKKYYDICVIGGAGIDRYFKTNDISLNSDVVPCETSFGSKGANVAVAASKAGAKVCLISIVGDDNEGKKILKNLKNYDIDCSSIIKSKFVKTDTSNVFIDDFGNCKILRNNSACLRFDTKMLQKYECLIRYSRLVVLQMKFNNNVTKNAINLCKKYGVKLILDPSPAEKFIQSGINLEEIEFLTPNAKEAEIIFGHDLEYAVTRYPNKVICTLGKKGIIFHDGSSLQCIKAIETAPVCETGAGDTFNGNFAARLSRGEALLSAIKKANVAAGLKTRFIGAQIGMPSENELQEFIDKNKIII